MPSKSFARFEEKLVDVHNLLDIHTELDSHKGKSGRRRASLQVLHKAGIALLVGAWETYVESLLEEGVMYLSTVSILGTDPEIKYANLQVLVKANVDQVTKRLHTPNSNIVRELYSNGFGIDDIRTVWRWQNMGWEQAFRALDQLLSARHSVVHGGDREFQKSDVKGWRGFLQTLVQKTDRAVSDHIKLLTGKNPW